DVPLSRLVHRERGARAAPAALRLARRRGRAHAPARARRAVRRIRPSRGRDVEGDAAAPRRRAGARRRAAPAHARRADVRTRPRRRGAAGVRRARALLDARGRLSRSSRRGDVVTAVWVIVGYGFREAVRRKMFAVVLVLTVAFLFLFWLANHYVFRDLSTISPPSDVHVDTRTFAGAFLIGLSMFATLFLGVVLAVFLTLGAVTGDAARGLLQPLVARPIGRSTLLVARFIGAGSVCTAYVLAVYFAGLLITGLTGHWWPDQVAWPGIELAGGVPVVIALSLLGSVVLSSTANGIAIFMLFGAGLVAGL